MQVTESGYGVEMFECDNRLEKISWENRHVKNQGSIYRMCFRPNAKAREDNVDIASIDSFRWEMTTVEAPGLVYWDSVKNGEADNQISQLVAHEPGKLFYLECLLPVKFYINTGAVEGLGSATMKLKSGSESLTFSNYMFKSDVSIDLSSLNLEQNMQDNIADKILTDL